MPWTPDNDPPASTRALVGVAVGVLMLSVAAPIAPGAGNSTGILMLSALVVLALASAPSRAGWLLVLVSLGIAAGAGAAPRGHWAYSVECDPGQRGPLRPAHQNKNIMRVPTGGDPYASLHCFRLAVRDLSD